VRAPSYGRRRGRIWRRGSRVVCPEEREEVREEEEREPRA
jgi:hypothetical protein